MELNSVNATVPNDRQAVAIENREPKETEKSESASQESREAYKVEISREAQKTLEASANQENAASEAENSEAVKAYTNTGRIAG